MTISIKNLRLEVILGANESERHAVREIIVHLRLDYDATLASASDKLTDALDYKSIRDKVVAVVRGSHFHLIEALVANIGKELRQDKRITSYALEIDKPGALRLADSVSVSETWMSPV